MSRHRGTAGSLTIGSLRGLPQSGNTARAARRPGARPAPPTALPVLEGAQLPPSRRGERCCRTGCAGCPVGEAIRRARARGAG